MTIGAYSITLTTPDGNTFPSGYTLCQRGSLNTDGRLRSVSPYFQTATSTVAKAVVWDGSGSKVAEGSLITFTPTASQPHDLPIDVVLTAGVNYFVGVYVQSGSALQTKQNSLAASGHSSTPLKFTFTDADSYSQFASGDAFPTTGGNPLRRLGTLLGLDVPPTSNVSYFDGTNWKVVNKYAHDGTSWKQHTVTTF